MGASRARPRLRIDLEEIFMDGEEEEERREVKQMKSSWHRLSGKGDGLKLEKDNMVLDLESTKAQLQGTEQLLAKVKSQLASTQKLNSLAETQLKCMAQSYKSLETHAEELQTEVNLLRAKTENLDNVLQEERQNHQDALAKFKGF
ncbi:Filament-like plant protein 4 [Camellia lanceoleosa]|uniref:Filament-like plant protein 4 n=1 Tax=Camellia lanceoleosa TaxID=1840588 RepID=A0ACC0GYJ7_9ERIC|nr:Filament-like plant protein 4 [Camellia lanceoleosa]